MLPPLVVVGKEWDDDSIDCGVDVLAKQYDDFAFATGAWRYAGGRDGRADGADACAN